eukprot:scaffold85740_cov66-Phaeocystis_antarctica.AAC.18
MWREAEGVEVAYVPRMQEHRAPAPTVISVVDDVRFLQHHCTARPTSAPEAKTRTSQHFTAQHRASFLHYPLIVRCSSASGGEPGTAGVAPDIVLCVASSAAALYVGTRAN